MGMNLYDHMLLDLELYLTGEVSQDDLKATRESKQKH